MEKQNILDLLALAAGIQPGLYDRRPVFQAVSDETETAALQSIWP